MILISEKVCRIDTSCQGRYPSKMSAVGPGSIAASGAVRCRRGDDGELLQLGEVRSKCLREC